MLNVVENSTGVSMTPGHTTPYFIQFLDAKKRRIAEIIMDYIVIFGISVLGVVTNTLVILVYTKQGYRESVAVSMTTISAWDLIKCIAGILNTFSGILSVFDPIAAHSWTNITTAVFNYVISFSAYVTSVMAAYVAVERCLCVLIPLKVKWLLTPRVTLIASLVTSVSIFGLFAVMFGIYDIVWIFDASMNATVAIYKKSDFYVRHEGPLFAYYNLSGTVWPIVSFIVILIATIIIFVKLRESSKFRLGNQGKDRSGLNSNSTDQQMTQTQNHLKRDRQVVKMLLVIIIIYIAALAPRIVQYLCKFIFYDFYFLRRGHYIFEFVVYIILTLDLLNGAVNFFVFYNMSSSFRATFQTMICYCKRSGST